MWPTNSSSVSQIVTNQTFIVTYTAVLFTYSHGISSPQEYLLEFTSEYGISKSLHLEFPGPEDPIVEFPKGKASVYTKFFEFANFCIPISQFLFDILGHYQIHLSQLSVIGAAKGAAPVGNPPHTGVAPELDLKKEMVDTGALVRKRRHKRGLGSKCTTQGAEEGLCRLPSPTEYPRGKSLASMRIGTGTAIFAPATQEIPVHTKGVSDPDPLSKVVVTEDLNSEKSTSFTSMVGSPGSIYQPGWGSQLRLRFEQETKLLKKAVAQVARQDKRIKAKGKHIRNVEALLEAEVDMKGAAEAKNVELAKELESLSVQFLDLQVSNNQLSQEVSTLQAQIMGEERIKAAFEEFKKYEDDWSPIDYQARSTLSGHECAESTELRQVFADVVSVGIAKGVVEGLKHRVEHGKAKVDLAAIEAYDPKADTKYVAAFHALKDLKYPHVDQLEKLKDAPIDVIMASLFLEIRNPKDPWSFKDEILLEDAIAANVSHAEKKKKCRVVYHTHRVGSTHHVRSDGVPLSVPIVALQGLAILLANAATQTEIIEDKTSLRLIRSKSLLPLYDLDCP
nr:hypothetical protein [Tanacetum cinerariifolium]